MQRNTVKRSNACDKERIRDLRKKFPDKHAMPENICLVFGL